MDPTQPQVPSNDPSQPAQQPFQPAPVQPQIAPAPQPAPVQPMPAPIQDQPVSPVQQFTPAPAPVMPQPAPMPSQPAPQPQQTQPQQFAQPAQMQNMQQPQTFNPAMPQQPQQPMQGPAPLASAGSMQVQAGMRKKILKIVGGLVAFSVIGVIGIFLLANSADPSLNDLQAESNALADYSVPASWRSETGSQDTIYFNGDSQPSSTALLSILQPIRVKFSGEKLTEKEVELFVAKFDELAAAEYIDVLSGSPKAVAVDTLSEFEQVYEAEFTHKTSTGAKIHTVIRYYFDEKAYLHGLSVDAVDGYWNANEEALRVLVESYKRSQ